MTTIILLIIFGAVVLIGGYFYLKDDRPFDYADIADIIEAEAYLESIKKKK
jgi:uncharacterized protein YpmB